MAKDERPESGPIGNTDPKKRGRGGVDRTGMEDLGKKQGKPKGGK
jgi:hypothetical protein